MFIKAIYYYFHYISIFIAGQATIFTDDNRILTFLCICGTIIQKGDFYVRWGISAAAYI